MSRLQASCHINSFKQLAACFPRFYCISRLLSYYHSFYFIHVQLTLDNSNSDFSNYAILEASIWIKDTFKLISSTIIWLLGLFYKFKLPEVQINLHFGYFELVKNNPINFEISSRDSTVHVYMCISTFRPYSCLRVHTRCQTRGQDGLKSLTWFQRHQVRKML